MKKFRAIKQAIMGGFTALLFVSGVLIVAAQQPPTLPPTWTPVPTFTPYPTATLTPVPTATLTPTPAPTIPAEELCARFTITGRPVEAGSLPYRGIGGFSWEGLPAETIVLLTLQRVDNAENIVIPFEAWEGFNAVFDATQLPGWGYYTWTLIIYRETEEICPHSGTFFREPWWYRPIDNPLYPPFIP